MNDIGESQRLYPKAGIVLYVHRNCKQCNKLILEHVIMKDDGMESIANYAMVEMTH